MTVLLISVSQLETLDGSGFSYSFALLIVRMNCFFISILSFTGLVGISITHVSCGVLRKSGPLIQRLFFWSWHSSQSHVASSATLLFPLIQCQSATTDVADWHWISGKSNVADEATRDWEECQLQKNSRWINGPDFLKTPQETWVMEMPTKPVKDNAEMKKQFIFTISNAHTYEKPDPSRCSNWLTLIKSTVIVKRTVSY